MTRAAVFATALILGGCAVGPAAVGVVTSTLLQPQLNRAMACFGLGWVDPAGTNAVQPVTEDADE